MVANSKNHPVPVLLWLILVAAVALRIAYLVVYASMPDWEMLTVDNYYHHNWAVDIANGNILGDTTYFRAPLYVWLLGGAYAVFGASLWTARLLGLLIGVASVAVTYALGARLFSRRAGLLAAALLAVWPTALYFESELLLDPLLLLLMELAVWRMIVWFDSKHPRDAFLVGLFLGLAAITRPTVLVLLAVVAGTLIVRRRGAGSIAHATAMVALGLIVTIGPVFARNCLVARDPVLIAAQGGINLYIGNNDAADGASATLPEPLGFNWQIRDIEWIAERAGGRELSPGEVSSYWNDRAIAWIRENPGRFVSLYLAKLYRSISTVEISNNRALGQFFARMPLLQYNPLEFGLLFALAIGGVIATVGASPRARIVAAVILIYLLASALFFFNSRFRLPLIPLYIIFAAGGIFALVDCLRPRPARALLLIVAMVAAGALSFLPLVPLSAEVSPQSLMASANYAFSQGDYRGALQFSREAARGHPDFPEVNLNIGNALVRLGDLTAARGAYEREAQVHPERAKAWTNLASLALVEGHLDRAIELSQKAITLRPYDHDANLVHVRALGQIDTLSPNALIAEIRAAAARTGDDIYLLNDAAIILNDVGHPDLASEILRRALDAVPPPIETDDYAFLPDFRHSRENMHRQYARAAYQLGFIAGVNGRFDEAIARSQQAIAYDSSLADAWVNLISGYLATGRRASADSTLTAAVRRFPNHMPLQQLRQYLRSQP